MGVDLGKEKERRKDRDVEMYWNQTKDRHYKQVEFDSEKNE